MRTLKQIPLEALIPSDTNPRKTFDDASLIALGASLARKQIEPILVRPWTGTVPNEIYSPFVDDYFEIICGERRYRGAKLAKLECLDAIIDDELSDADARALQFVENDDREPVHPLERAKGLADLLASESWKKIPDAAGTLATQLGVSKSALYASLKLLDLTEEAQLKFHQGSFSEGHAILIARLTPKDQQEAVSYVLRTGNYHHWTGTPGVRELGDWIRKDKSKLLSLAPFDRLSNTLLPRAGACSECSKRSEDGEYCLDVTCFKSKIDIHLANTVQALKDSGETPVLVTSSYSGGSKGVFENHQWKEAQKTDKGAKTAVNVTTGAVIYAITPETPNGRIKKSDSEKENDRLLRDSKKFRLALVAEIVDTVPAHEVPPWDANAMRWLLRAFWERLENTDQILVGKALGWQPVETKVTYQTNPVQSWRGDCFDLNASKYHLGELNRLARIMSLHREINPMVYTSATDPKGLMALAAGCKLDVEMIRKQTTSTPPVQSLPQGPKARNNSSEGQSPGKGNALERATPWKPTRQTRRSPRRQRRPKRAPIAMNRLPVKGSPTEVSDSVLLHAEGP